MPIRFTDEVVVSYGKILFREKREEESIEEYRKALADDQESKDVIQAHEIRTGKPWDEWGPEEFNYRRFYNMASISKLDIPK
jgi:hypothetical protein